MAPPRKLSPAGRGPQRTSGACDYDDEAMRKPPPVPSMEAPRNAQPAQKATPVPTSPNRGAQLTDASFNDGGDVSPLSMRWSDAGEANRPLALTDLGEQLSPRPSSGGLNDGLPPYPPDVPMTPKERRAFRQQHDLLRAQSGAASDPGENNSAPNSAPSTLAQWRPADNRPPTGASRSSSATAGGISATDRLRERMQKRSGIGGGGGGGAGDWKERIENRKVETEQQQEMEKEERHIVAERAGRRAEAMRRVQERQRQRQEEVVGLEA